MPRRGRARVYRWGDWRQARTIFNGLSFRLQKAAEKGMWEVTQASARRIKHNITSQNYPHHPLSEWQASAKAAAGQDSRILIADGSYVKAIRAMHLGRGAYGVGIPSEDQLNVDKGTMHEWGGRNNLGHLVPGRPHYRVELERLKNSGLRTLSDYLRDAMQGKSYLSSKGSSVVGINHKSEL